MHVTFLAHVHNQVAENYGVVLKKVVKIILNTNNVILKTPSRI